MSHERCELACAPEGVSRRSPGCKAISTVDGTRAYSRPYGEHRRVSYLACLTDGARADGSFIGEDLAQILNAVGKGGHAILPETINSEGAAVPATSVPDR